jgi:hypothetical protein
MPTIKCAIFFVLTVMSACACTRETIDSKEMYKRASALSKLSSAMESYIRYDRPLASLSEAELLAAGTRHNPSLLTNMGDYRIRILSRDRHAVVLMCTSSGERALLEDAGCTGKMDVHHWQNDNIPCEFSVVAAEVCKAD